MEVVITLESCEEDIGFCSEMLGCGWNAVLLVILSCLGGDTIHSSFHLVIPQFIMPVFSEVISCWSFLLASTGCLTWLVWFLITGMWGQSCVMPWVHSHRCIFF